MKSGLLKVFLAALCMLSFSACGSQEDTSGGKKNIILAGDPADIPLKKMVDSFNLNSSTYSVVIEEYEQERLLTEISSGKGPDLIDNNYVDFHAAVRNGLIEDLNVYLENSDSLSKDMLFENILEAFTIDGVLTCIPPSFAIEGVYGRASDLSSFDSWGMDEFLKYVNENQGCTIMEGSNFGQSQQYIVMLSYWFEEEKWVDYTNGKSNFDSPNFKELLKFALGYDAIHDMTVLEETTEERWESGKILFLNNVLVNISDYYALKELMGEDMYVMGYPAFTDEHALGAVGYRGFGMNSNSKVKEGAWEFIEFQLSNQEGDLKADSGIPTMKSGYQEMLDKYRQYRQRQTDKEVHLEELEAEFEQLIQKISFGRTGYSAIETILVEEVNTLFLEGKPVEEVAEAVHNRVQLYLDEQG